MLQSLNLPLPNRPFLANEGRRPGGDAVVAVIWTVGNWRHWWGTEFVPEASRVVARLTAGVSGRR
jgi:hypothetical protein